MDPATQARAITEPSILTPKELVQNALEANKVHQYALTKHAERLAAELQEMEKLMSAVNTDDEEDEPDAEIQVPGAKKPSGPFPISEFLNPSSPFFEEASRRTRYINDTTVHLMKAKELDILADAVRYENQRLQAIELQKRSREEDYTHIDLDKNTEGLDWTLIAEKVSDACKTKRTADQCRIKWLGDRYPGINHGEWTPGELDDLRNIVRDQLEHAEHKVDWVYVANKLGTNRTPIDCMRRGFPRQRHTWNLLLDQKLSDAVQLYGTNNWSIVARVVSEDATAAQCQGRYSRTIDPLLKRGTWSDAEIARLKVAVEAYGNNWIDIAACIPGRTNEQCRERWIESQNALTGKESWTKEEDEALLDAVSVMGNQWKLISTKLGSERTGTQCRLRYDKLKKIHAPQSATTQAGPSNQVENSNDNLDAARPKNSRTKKNAIKTVVAHTTTNEVTITPIPKPRPKPRPTGKGKGKKKTTEPLLDPVTDSGDFIAQDPDPDPDLDGMASTKKRESAQNSVEGPATKRRKVITGAEQADDGDSQNAPQDQHPQSVQKRNRLAPRKGAIQPIAPMKLPLQSETSAGEKTGGDPPRTEVVTSRPKPKPKGRAKPNTATEGVGTGVPGHADSEDIPETNTSTLRPKPRPRGRPKKVIAPAQTPASVGGPDPILPVASVAPSQQKGRSKAIVPTATQDGTPQRQSARVAARKLLVATESSSGTELAVATTSGKHVPEQGENSSTVSSPLSIIDSN